jgi:hypothetical protein
VITSWSPRKLKPDGGVPLVTSWMIETGPATGEVTEVWSGSLGEVVDPVEIEPPAATSPLCAASATVTVKLADPTLPAPSVAWQVTCVGPSGNVEPDAGEQVGVSVPLTRSLAVAVYVTGVGVADTTTVGDGTVTVGGVVSRTVTWNVVVAVFESESVAVHVTVVVPSGNVEPEAGVQVTGSVPSVGSVAVGLV